MKTKIWLKFFKTNNYKNKKIRTELCEIQILVGVRLLDQYPTYDMDFHNSWIFTPHRPVLLTLYIIIISHFVTVKNQN